MTLIFKQPYASKLRLLGFAVVVASFTAAFAGQCIDGISGRDCLLPNSLCPDDVTSRQGSVSPADAGAQAWYGTIAGPSAHVETFIEDPARLGTKIPAAAQTFTVGTTLSPSSKILTLPWIATPDRDRCGRRLCPPSSVTARLSSASLPTP